jgi:predicted nucleic acid-binding protein
VPGAKPLIRAVRDANVLYPFTLRDTLLRAAAAGLFRVHWSEQILEETTRNLVADGIVTAGQAARLRAAMDRAFPEALVSGYEDLVPEMRNDEKDRHVAAAAHVARAQVIVTGNLGDCRQLPRGIQAQHPDGFLCRLLELNPGVLSAVVREQAAEVRRPPRTLDDVLRALGKVVPTFVARLGAPLHEAE